MSPEVMQALAPAASILGVIGVAGWVITTWMRVKHGYPLENSWGKAVYPRTSSEEAERIKLLSQENAQLRAELGSIRDRLGTVERIVTDSGYHLTQQIDALRELPRN
ncbi:MAG: hypothetical protein RL702_2178 [Pseudomonadota bacterium]|jgi:hypothetical protein|nr:hypothetical protein [Novosphingobium sp.]HOA50269.1 hypothetical protein [Novosphingobium sp.]HPB21601.1 hypothetical protein [Novosphingobium sp.]HPZ47351.1 hypothetical protein [Novosphingobium sp.]HQE00582.1 hypothetical protein [Novosphingobium sp.]